MTTGRTHSYATTVTWTGNGGEGTASYRSYARSYDITAEGKPVIAGSSDPAFRGDAACWNPEDLLVASLSACHMLWFLHLCAVARIVVESYDDDATGTMTEGEDGGGRFREVVLHPVVGLRDRERQDEAAALHHQAHTRCFIANSVNFPVRVEPRFA